MKKKVILLSLVLMLLLTGVVSAAALWGKYKGYNIVRLMVNDVPVKVSDAPAFIFDNRTMIPIYLLQQAGIKYAWDQKTKTLDIQDIDESIQHVDSLKKYSVVAHNYKLLNDFYYRVSLERLTVTTLGIAKSVEMTESSVNTMYELDSALKKLSSEVNTSLSYTGTYVFDVDSYSSITKNYSESLRYLTLSLSEMILYLKDGAQKNLSNSNNYMDDSGYFLNLAEQSSGEGYATFQKLIFDYTVKTIDAPVTTKPVVISPPAINGSTGFVIDTGTVNSKIKDNFEGFENGKIFQLTNGQIWKQTSFEIKVSFKYQPDVTIYKDGFYWYMIVNGVDKKVRVEKLK